MTEKVKTPVRVTGVLHRLKLNELALRCPRKHVDTGNVNHSGKIRAGLTPGLGISLLKPQMILR